MFYLIINYHNALNIIFLPCQLFSKVVPEFFSFSMEFLVINHLNSLLLNIFYIEPFIMYLHKNMSEYDNGGHILFQVLWNYLKIN